jgi:hypothetical protein
MSARLAGVAVILGALAIAGQNAFLAPALAASARTSAVSSHVKPKVPAAMADCPVTWSCGWANPNFATGPGMWQGPNADFTAFNSDQACSSGTWNDCIQSIYNHFRTNDIFWFAGAHCAGGAAGALELTPGQSIANLNNSHQPNGNSWAQVISSDNVNSTKAC